MSLLVQKGLVTTIIPVYNGPAFIVDAVNSVLSQTYSDVEIIIVDDGSTDNTPLVIANLANESEQVRVFHQTNSGPGVARELGRLNARGEYIQYLDSDDLLLPNKFQEQIMAFAQDDQADVAYGMTETIAVGSERKLIPDGHTGEEHRSMFPLLLRERWWSTSTPLFKRSVVEKAGPWSAMSNEEDWEYEANIASYGGRLVFTNTFVSITRSHDDHLCVDGDKEPNKLQNRAMSRARIYQHAKRYMELGDRPAEIEDDDWVIFSKYAFLLARQCALVGLTTEARAMVSISIEAVGKKTVAHRIFLKLVKLFGWKRAAELIRATGR